MKVQEICERVETLSEEEFNAVLAYLQRKQEQKISREEKTAGREFLSASSFGDWLSDEEDAAWAHLQ